MKQNIAKLSVEKRRGSCHELALKGNIDWPIHVHILIRHLLCVGNPLQRSLTFWHQGPVSWKTIFPRAEGGVGRGGVMVQAVMRVMGSGR